MTYNTQVQLGSSILMQEVDPLAHNLDHGEDDDKRKKRYNSSNIGVSRRRERFARTSVPTHIHEVNPSRQRRALKAIRCYALVVFLLVMSGCTAPARPYLSSPPTTKPPISIIAIPGLPDTQYVVGQAHHFEFIYDAQAACREWTTLPEAQKRGLAFVDARAVPGCADSSYALNASAIRNQRAGLVYPQPQYFDLGFMRTPGSYNGNEYSCAEVTKVVMEKFGPHPYPKPALDYDITPDERQTLQRWDAYHQEFQLVYQMYSNGGTFADGCYPPGAVFGADYSITFFPSTPVQDILEAGAPVYGGVGDPCNVCGIGAAYTVKAGDTLGSISTCFYGFDSEWPSIAATNRIADVKALPVDRVIHLPGITDASQCVKPFS